MAGQKRSLLRPTYPYCIVFLMTIIMMVPRFGISSEIPSGLWRVPENDAINVLYIFLRVHGYQETYCDYLSHVHRVRNDPTLTSLKNTSNELGYPTHIIKASVEDILQPSFPKPAVLYFDRFGSQLGEWHLLLFADGTRVGIVNGSTVIIDLISMDRFRTAWTGYALTATNPRPLFAAVLRYSSIGFACLAALSLVVRRPGWCLYKQRSGCQSQVHNG